MGPDWLESEASSDHFDILYNKYFVTVYWQQLSLQPFA